MITNLLDGAVTYVFPFLAPAALIRAIPPEEYAHRSLLVLFLLLLRNTAQTTVVADTAADLLLILAATRGNHEIFTMLMNDSVKKSGRTTVMRRVLLSVLEKACRRRLNNYSILYCTGGYRKGYTLHVYHMVMVHCRMHYLY